MSHKREWNLGPGSLFDYRGDLPSSSLVPPHMEPKKPRSSPRDRGFSYPAVAATTPHNKKGSRQRCKEPFPFSINQER